MLHQLLFRCHVFQVLHLVVDSAPVFDSRSFCKFSSILYSTPWMFLWNMSASSWVTGKWTKASWIFNIWPCIISNDGKEESQLDAECFGQRFCPSSGALDCAIQLVVCCTQYFATYWVQHTTCCIAQSKAPDDGQNCCPKHVTVIGFINKPLLLHLVGFLLYHPSWIYLEDIHSFLLVLVKWNLVMLHFKLSEEHTN